MRWMAAVMVLLGLVAACAAPTASPPAATLPPTAAPTLSPSPTPVPTAIPTPTVDAAALADLAGQGVEVAGGDEADVITLRYEDMDADGLPEWLAVVQPEEGAALQGFVLDGETSFPLEGTNPRSDLAGWGLGLYPDCEVQIADLNADGVPEIALFGHGPRQTTLLHLYEWDGTTYRLLGAFAGDGGVTIEDRDGDLTAEIVEGYHDDRVDDLVWQIVFTWQEGSYGWTSDRWAWYYRQRPHVYPDQAPDYAVIAFYLALDDRDMPAAYDLLSRRARAEQDYASWVVAFDTLLRVEVGDLHAVPGVGTETTKRITAMVLTWNNIHGEVIVRSWNVEWDVVREDEGWRLDRLEAVQLDSWPLPYWP